jgi:uncharacterized protein (DUF1501 family)
MSFDPSTLHGPNLGRRRFLQSAGAAATVSMLPMWLADQVGATTPLAADEGVVVVLTMSGGNDGLSTFVPITDGAYYDARRSLAFQPGDTLAMTEHRGLNPHLPFVKNQWDQGRLAVVEGVGQIGSNLSHFVSMAQIMALTAGGKPPTSGWLGRVLDGLGDEPMTGVAIGTSVPLILQGERRLAAAIPEHGSNLRHIDYDRSEFGNVFATINGFSHGSNGKGELADMVCGRYGQSIDLARDLQPLIEEERDEPQVVTKLRLAARLINANLGIRMISIEFGDFDSHANQRSMHRDRMQELNSGLETFFGELHPNFDDRTLVVGNTEFGRRVRSNGSGTDHGTANSLFAIGAKVNGGFHGQAPSLTQLDDDRNQLPTVDFRHFCANIITTWLNADAGQIVGQDFDDLGFLNRPGQAGSTQPVVQPITVSPKRKKRAEVARLYLAYFLREPDEEGYEYWVGVRESGASLGKISAEFAASPEFKQRYGSLNNRQFVQLVYGNVLRRNADSGGLNYWSGLLDAGTSRGEVMVGFSESTEFQTRTESDMTSIEHNGPVGRLYMAYFLRRPDEAGLDYWINTGLPTAAISEQFAQSAEFKNRYGSLANHDFVELAYWNVLGRGPDNGGLHHWANVLDRGGSRGAVMQGFSDSPEFKQRVKLL